MFMAVMYVIVVPAKELIVSLELYDEIIPTILETAFSGAGNVDERLRVSPAGEFAN